MGEAGGAPAAGLTASAKGPRARSVAAVLTDRRLSVALMAFVAAVGLVGAVVPQRVNTPPVRFEAWLASAGVWGRAAVSLGLDRVFSAWWFVAVLAVFAVSLTVATVRMFGAAWRRTGRSGVLAGRGRRAVRIWATPVLHLGLALGLVAAAASAAASSRAVLDLSAGEVHEPGAPYLVEDRGPLGSTPDLGGPVRLDGIDTTAWDGGDLRTLTARLSVQREGEWTTYASSANDPLRLDGHVVYVQPGEFGDAAFLEIRRGEDLVARSRMEFTYTAAGSVAYSDIVIADGTRIDGRWDPSRTRGADRLALRPADGDEDAVELVDVGGRAQVGGYEVTFVDVRPWARIIVSRPYFTGWLFAAFGVIALGSAARYLSGVRPPSHVAAEGAR